MNKQFKRFRLTAVDEDLEHKKVKELKDYNPGLHDRAREQIEFEQILNNNRLNPEEKISILGLLVQSFQSGQIPRIETAAAPAQVVAPVQYARPAQDDYSSNSGQAVSSSGQAVASLSGREFISKLPKTLQEQSKSLSKFLQNHPSDFDVTDQNELIINGKVIPHSSAPTLFKYLYNPGNTSSLPIGYSQAMNSFVKLGVPPTYLSNKSARSFLRDAIQTGTGRIIGYARRPKSRKLPTKIKLKDLHLFKL